ncbi:MAG: 4-hydroxy-tetrahydrodipicolinate synthase [Clostridiales bacterium]
MNNPVFKGSCVALITPFTDNGVDFKKLEKLIEFQIENGTDSILICGTTGESSTMPDSEHKEVIRFAVDIINKRIPVIAGTGSNDTNHTIEMSKFAQKVGVDAVLLVSPYYNKTTQVGLYEHFKKIANSIEIPVILYNVPTRTSININPETILKLSKIDNIIAVKECNFNQVAEVIHNCGDDFSVYSGNDDLAYAVLSLGGKGLISVMANIIPKETHLLVKNYLDGKIEESRKIQFKYLDLIKSLFVEVSPIPLKYIMNYIGFEIGQCRLPLVDLGNSNHKYVKKIIDEYKLSNISLN